MTAPGAGPPCSSGRRTDPGEVRGHFAAALEEQAVAQLHDIGLVDGHHLLTALAVRPFEGRARDLGRRLLGDDLQTLYHAGYHFVFQAGIEIFGVLAEDRSEEHTSELQSPCNLV